MDGVSVCGAQAGGEGASRTRDSAVAQRQDSAQSWVWAGAEGPGGGRRVYTKRGLATSTESCRLPEVEKDAD